MFEGIVDLIEGVAMLVEEKAYKVTHPYTWSGYHSSENDETSNEVSTKTDKKKDDESYTDLSKLPDIFIPGFDDCKSNKVKREYIRAKEDDENILNLFEDLEKFEKFAGSILGDEGLELTNCIKILADESTSDKERENAMKTLSSMVIKIDMGKIFNAAMKNEEILTTKLEKMKSPVQAEYSAKSTTAMKNEEIIAAELEKMESPIQVEYSAKSTTASNKRKGAKASTPKENNKSTVNLKDAIESTPLGKQLFEEVPAPAN